MKFRAFIFDLDGVLINSESVWQTIESEFMDEIFGTKIYKQIKHQILGGDIRTIYDKARRIGATIDKQTYLKRYNETASEVYRKAKITTGSDILVNALMKKEIHIGIVTASPKTWVNMALSKFSQARHFQCIVSIAENNTLRPKPAPDGYLEAMRLLEVPSEEAIAIEDSSFGVAAAKAAGLFTICFRQYHSVDYRVSGADLYVENMNEVLDWIERNEKK